MSVFFHIIYFQITPYYSSFTCYLFLIFCPDILTKRCNILYTFELNITVIEQPDDNKSTISNEF